MKPAGSSASSAGTCEIELPQDAVPMIRPGISLDWLVIPSELLDGLALSRPANDLSCVQGFDVGDGDWGGSDVTLLHAVSPS